MIRQLTVAGAVAVLSAGAVDAQSMQQRADERAGMVLRSLSPKVIREALDCGAGSDYCPTQDDYVWRAVDGMQVVIITPFYLISQAAREAKQKYLTLSEDKIDPSLLPAQVTLYIPAYMTGKNITDDVVSIQHVVSAPAAMDTPGPGDVIQPITSKAEESEWTSGFGAKRTGVGITATFPISVLSLDRQFRIVLSDGREVRMRLNEMLAKIR